LSQSRVAVAVATAAAAALTQPRGPVVGVSPSPSLYPITGFSPLILSSHSQTQYTETTTEATTVQLGHFLFDVILCLAELARSLQKLHKSVASPTRQLSVVIAAVFKFHVLMGRSSR